MPGSCSRGRISSKSWYRRLLIRNPRPSPMVGIKRVRQYANLPDNFSPSPCEHAGCGRRARTWTARDNEVVLWCIRHGTEEKRRNREAGSCKCGQDRDDRHLFCEDCRNRMRKQKAEWRKRARAKGLVEKRGGGTGLRDKKANALLAQGKVSRWLMREFRRCEAEKRRRREAEERRRDAEERRRKRMEAIAAAKAQVEQARAKRIRIRRALAAIDRGIRGHPDNPRQLPASKAAESLCLNCKNKVVRRKQGEFNCWACELESERRKADIAEKERLEAADRNWIARVERHKRKFADDPVDDNIPGTTWMSRLG